MKTDELLKDPVFQLNILLWMAKEQPADNYYVKPLFHELGFKIRYIEDPFAFPEVTYRAITDSGLDISPKPEPEMILGRESDNKALYFEAKANSFGTESSNCKQARAHLVATGPAFREVLTPLESCLLCYVVPDNARNQMSECLSSLSKELKGKGLNPGPFSSHGLAVSGTQIVYSWNGAFKNHVGIKEDSTPIINGVEPNTDPAPLILVFSDEDCSNDTIRDFYRRVIIDQIRACLLCDLRAHLVGEKYETTPEILLAKTTDGIFKFVNRKRRKGLQRLVHENIFKKIRDHWKDKQSGVGLEKDKLTVTWSAIKEKEDFLDWMEDRRTRFDTSKPEEKPLPLLDQLDNGPMEAQ